MAEWLIEEGIGEHRAILVERGEIIAAQVDWLEPVRPGLIADARLVSKPAGSKRGIARLDSGQEVLVDRLAPAHNEGCTLRLAVGRSPIAERGRNKLAQARPAPSGAALSPGPTLLEQIKASRYHVTRCRPADGAFNDLGWDELVEDALSGTVVFAGGSLTIDPTPAMTTIDIDGHLPPVQLAIAAIPAIVESLGRFDIGGSIVIDFPTIEARKDRQVIDSALTEALADWQGERTAMNGFGLVQLVSRLERASIAQRYRGARHYLALVTLARRAESVQGHGPLLLCANPLLQTAIAERFESEIAARTGRPLKWHWSNEITLNSPYVQVVNS